MSYCNGKNIEIVREKAIKMLVLEKNAILRLNTKVNGL